MKKAIEIVSNCVLAIVILAIVAISIQGSVSFAFSQDKHQPIYRGSSASNIVSLMINVYWGTEYVVPMLDTLDKYNAKVTFFVGGSWAAGNIEIVKEILNRGHELGNHGYFHKDQGKLSYQANYDEINTCTQLILTNTNYQMKLFAPPSGDFSQNTLQSAYQLGYKTIMWSRDTVDWRDKDSTTVYNRATKNISGGELILMHPTLHTSNALEKILKYYKEHNFVVDTVSNNIDGGSNANIQDIPKWTTTGSQTHAIDVYCKLWSIC